MGFGALLRRGIAAGVAAGVAAALMMWLVVEPVLRRALVVEEARGAHSHGVGGDEPPVTRGMQVVGGTITSALVGVIFGVLFAVAFALLRHRLPARTEFGRAVLLAGLGFFVFSLLPGLTLPASPPGVGEAATVTQRSWLYVTIIVLGLLLVATVAVADHHLHRRAVPMARRLSVDTVLFAALLAAVFVLVPSSPDRLPSDLPPDLLWDFRLASLGQLAVMWSVLGLCFGLLVRPGGGHPELDSAIANAGQSRDPRW